MPHPDRSRLLGALLAASLALPAGAAETSSGLLGDPRGEASAQPIPRELPAPVQEKLLEAALKQIREQIWKVKAVPDFDPARDVPAMKNWEPLANVEGAAHCFAVSLLTSFFHKRILFREDREHARVKLDGSWGRGDLKKRILDTDEIGLQLIFEYLATYDDGGRLQVGGFSGLREFTAPGAIGEEFFMREAEAIQFLLQIVTMGHRYAGTLVFSNLGSIPFSNVSDNLDEAARKAILLRAYGKIKKQIEDGELAPFTMHPSKLATDGHVIVGYQVRERGDRAQILCYDSNYPPEGEQARPTVVHLDLARGTFQVKNHAGETKYSRYELLTFIDPDGKVIRHAARETIQHLDKTTAATNLFYAGLEVASRKGLTPMRNQAFVEEWKRTKQLYKETASRRVRWSINFSR